MVMLTMRAKRFLKNTGRKLNLNGTKKIGIGRTQEGLCQWTTTSNALVSCDGSSYDWSDQAQESPTNFALMAYSSTSSNSEVSKDSNFAFMACHNLFRKFNLSLEVNVVLQPHSIVLN
ncbi:hypothetical protein Tco_1372798 [Tanacetum coccineum]